MSLLIRASVASLAVKVCSRHFELNKSSVLTSCTAEQNYFRYVKRHTHERVARSCAGEMEREVHDVLGPLGLDQALSRRVAGSLLKAESELSPDLKEDVSFFRQLLQKIARKPSALSDANGGASYGTIDAAEQGSPKASDCDVGMTAFLLKFGEGAEEVPTSRLFICGFL